MPPSRFGLGSTLRKSQISANELFFLLFEQHEIKSGSVGVLFRSFFDDSADGLREKFVIAGSLLGKHKSWSQFNREWRKALHQYPQIRWFHTKEWRSLTGE